MQYLVNVCGDVSNKQNKTYVVNSSSAEDAQIVAKQYFFDDFGVRSCEVFLKPHKRTYVACLSFILMLIPILLSLINWKVGHKTISVSPDYISCLYGVLIYSAFIVRFKGIKRTVSSWIDILFCVFVVLLLSTFIKTIMVTQTIDLFGFKSITINTSILLPIVIALSWLGLKIVSLVCMVALVLIAMLNIVALNEAMGMFFGSLYIISSFVGVLLYLSVEPVLSESICAISKATLKGVKYISNDVAQAKSKIVESSSSALKKDDQLIEKGNENEN